MIPILTIQIENKLKVLVSTKNTSYSKEGCKKHSRLKQTNKPYASQNKRKLNDFRSKDFNIISLKLMDFNYTLLPWGSCLLCPALRSWPGEKV